ncbi:serine protease 3-like [Contarinia nasturtii]|uniref:serine protease 3-like n=1 Tax=Contarinia nasturtii TaxID=265458 RepID=UPI0012D4AB88|nr:serine protease 3-like [Contarinia nasturtii]
MKLFLLLFALFFVISDFSGKFGFGVEAIIDGELVKDITQHKYVTGILINKKVNRSIFRFYGCTGVIVSKYKILTAAHCLFGRSSLTLAFGSVDLSNSSYAVVVTSEDFTTYPGYVDELNKHDIGVIELKEPLPFGKTIGRIEMVEKDYIPDSSFHNADVVTILGYTESSEAIGRKCTPSKLRWVQSMVHRFDTCKSMYAAAKPDEPLLNLRKEFCICLEFGSKHVTNSGDSGGPVIIEDKFGNKKLLGLTTYDHGDLPEVCTLVSGYRNFIANPKLFVQKYYERASKAMN